MNQVPRSTVQGLAEGLQQTVENLEDLELNLQKLHRQSSVLKYYAKLMEETVQALLETPPDEQFDEK